MLLSHDGIHTASLHEILQLLAVALWVANLYQAVG